MIGQLKSLVGYCSKDVLVGYQESSMSPIY
jgi:hypothetical protein